MSSRSRRIRGLELCDANIFGQIVVTKQTMPMKNPRVRSAVWAQLKPPPIQPDDDPKEYEKRRASVLLDQLLLEIYSNLHAGYSDYNSATSSRSHRATYKDRVQLREEGIEELRSSIGGLEGHVVRIGSILVRQLKRRDALRRQRDARCDVISYLLRKRVPEFSPEMRFSIEPLPGDSGFSQWHSAMKMVSQLPEGIPPEFRRRLWLSLADKHLFAKGIDWSRVERNCFSEWSHPSDAELGVQIVKDLHRTGCSLFCGKDGQENQALLKRVLLAYARWNKAVGYCQGFNMLAALILQVTEKCETDALKLMIYLIEGVLPDSYFADSLRGLSVDMAVFRELLRTKLPRLSRHLDTLQVASKEGTTSYEPPLTNVFTMQWFLTLFCNCLPQPTVLRVWDLILLEGNEILLRTALAIWQVLAERIMTAKSADEFYCVMGMLMREILEFDLIDANTLIKGIVTIGPLTELHTLREHYLYNITPWGASMPAGDSDRRMKVYHKDRLVLDIGVLKKQYTKLKQRQRQAHIIFNTAVARQTARTAPVAMNHLLLGKSALVPAKRLGPPKGAIPPARLPVHVPPPQPPKTLHWKDTTRRDSSSSSTSSSDTELCDEPEGAEASDDEDDPKCQLPDDNLTEPSDKTLMTEDNTKQTSASASGDLAEAKPDLDNQIELKSDIFDNSETSDLYELNALQRSDSAASEDGFDFEKFLEERVKSFKEKTFSSEESIEDTSEQERLRYARRNSVRALEIIQENSLILHRILQCQSRMTPTPPPAEEEDDRIAAAGLDLPIPEEMVARDDEDATPTNEFTASRDGIDCGQINRSASLEGIISKYSTIGLEGSLEEVDYHLEKYRQKLGSPIAEEVSPIGAEETKNKESCEKINKYIQNAIENMGYPKISKDNYNQNLPPNAVGDIKDLNVIQDSGLPKEKGPPEDLDLIMRTDDELKELLNSCRQEREDCKSAGSKNNRSNEFEDFGTNEFNKDVSSKREDGNVYLLEESTDAINLDNLTDRNTSTRGKTIEGTIHLQYLIDENTITQEETREESVERTTESIQNLMDEKVSTRSEETKERIRNLMDGNASTRIEETKETIQNLMDKNASTRMEETKERATGRIQNLVHGNASTRMEETKERASGRIQNLKDGNASTRMEETKETIQNLMDKNASTRMEETKERADGRIQNLMDGNASTRMEETKERATGAIQNLMDGNASTRMEETKERTTKTIQNLTDGNSSTRMFTDNFQYAGYTEEFSGRSKEESFDVTTKATNAQNFNVKLTNNLHRVASFKELAGETTEKLFEDTEDANNLHKSKHVNASTREETKETSYAQNAITGELKNKRNLHPRGVEIIEELGEEREGKLFEDSTKAINLVDRNLHLHGVDSIRKLEEESMGKLFEDATRTVNLMDRNLHPGDVKIIRELEEEHQGKLFEDLVDRNIHLHGVDKKLGEESIGKLFEDTTKKVNLTDKSLHLQTSKSTEKLEGRLFEDATETANKNLELYGVESTGTLEESQVSEGKFFEIANRNLDPYGVESTRKLEETEETKAKAVNFMDGKTKEKSTRDTVHIHNSMDVNSSDNLQQELEHYYKDDSETLKVDNLYQTETISRIEESTRLAEKPSWKSRNIEDKSSLITKEEYENFKAHILEETYHYKTVKDDKTHQTKTIAHGEESTRLAGKPSREFKNAEDKSSDEYENFRAHVLEETYHSSKITQEESAKEDKEKIGIIQENEASEQKYEDGDDVKQYNNRSSDATPSTFQILSEDKSKNLEESISSIKRRDINKDFAILQQSVRELNRSLNYPSKHEKQEDYLSTCEETENTNEDYLSTYKETSSDHLHEDDSAASKEDENFYKSFQNPSKQDEDIEDFYKSFQNSHSETEDRSRLNLDSLMKDNFDDDYDNEVFMDKLESPKSLKDFSECRRPSLPVVEEEVEETVCAKANGDSAGQISCSVTDVEEKIEEEFQFDSKIGKGIGGALKTGEESLGKARKGGICGTSQLSSDEADLEKKIQFDSKGKEIGGAPKPGKTRKEGVGGSLNIGEESLEKTVKGGIGGGLKTHGETEEEGIGGRLKIGEESLEKTVKEGIGGSFKTLVETEEGGIGGSFRARVETEEGAIGGSFRTCEETEKGRIVGSLKTGEESLEKTVKEGIGGSFKTHVETEEGGIGGSFRTREETVKGRIVGSLKTGEESLEKIVKEGIGGSFKTRAETEEGGIGGSFRTRVETEGGIGRSLKTCEKSSEKTVKEGIGGRFKTREETEQRSISGGLKTGEESLEKTAKQEIGGSFKTREGTEERGIGGRLQTGEESVGDIAKNGIDRFVIYDVESVAKITKEEIDVFRKTGNSLIGNKLRKEIVEAVGVEEESAGKITRKGTDVTLIIGEESVKDGIDGSLKYDEKSTKLPTRERTDGSLKTGEEFAGRGVGRSLVYNEESRGKITSKGIDKIVETSEESVGVIRSLTSDVESVEQIRREDVTKTGEESTRRGVDGSLVYDEESRRKIASKGIDRTVETSEESVGVYGPLIFDVESVDQFTRKYVTAETVGRNLKYDEESGRVITSKGSDVTLKTGEESVGVYGSLVSDVEFVDPITRKGVTMETVGREIDGSLKYEEESGRVITSKGSDVTLKTGVESVGVYGSLISEVEPVDRITRKGVTMETVGREIDGSLKYDEESGRVITSKGRDATLKTGEESAGRGIDESLKSVEGNARKKSDEEKATKIRIGVLETDEDFRALKYDEESRIIIPSKGTLKTGEESVGKGIDESPVERNARKKSNEEKATRKTDEDCTEQSIVPSKMSEVYKEKTYYDYRKYATLKTDEELEGHTTAYSDADKNLYGKSGKDVAGTRPSYNFDFLDELCKKQLAKINEAASGVSNIAETEKSKFSSTADRERTIKIGCEESKFGRERTIEIINKNQDFKDADELFVNKEMSDYSKTGNNFLPIEKISSAGLDTNEYTFTRRTSKSPGKCRYEKESPEECRYETKSSLSPEKSIPSDKERSSVKESLDEASPIDNQSSLNRRYRIISPLEEEYKPLTYREASKYSLEPESSNNSRSKMKLEKRDETSSPIKQESLYNYKIETDEYREESPSKYNYPSREVSPRGRNVMVSQLEGESLETYKRRDMSSIYQEKSPTKPKHALELESLNDSNESSRKARRGITSPIREESSDRYKKSAKSYSLEPEGRLTDEDSLLDREIPPKYSFEYESPRKIPASLEESRQPEKESKRQKYKHPHPSGEEAMIEIAKTSKYTSILEYSRNLDERFNNLILKAPGPNLTYSYSAESEDAQSSSGLLRSPSIEGQASPRSPGRSPSHAYNPFPVSISSRQNKEVAVRLGLYKKS